MKHYFRLAFTIAAMLAVMLLAAGATLRLALHGREVAIPDLAGMTLAEASDSALHSGLDLNVENKFYSTTIPAGRVLSQAPAAGSKVRHGWQVRVTVSLGPQQVTIPDVVGEPVRDATMNMRRMQLDLGTLAHLDAPGDPDMTLAQTPPPNAGVDQPRVNLLLSSSGGSVTGAFVLPSFLGMSYASANHAAIALGLRVAALGDVPTALPAPATSAPAAAPTGTAGVPADNSAPAPTMTAGGPVTAQSPPSGFRAGKGDVLRLTFGHSSSSSTATQTAPASSPAVSTPVATAPQR